MKNYQSATMNLMSVGSNKHWRNQSDILIGNT